jgi:hypothetical protein
MTNKNDKNVERVVPNDRAAVFSILRSIGDTTWRMFTPPVILVPVGIWADLKWQTKPWLTLLSLVVGLGLSVLLVRQQLRGSQ